MRKSSCQAGSRYENEFLYWSMLFLGFRIKIKRIWRRTRAYLRPSHMQVTKVHWIGFYEFYLFLFHSTKTMFQIFFLHSQASIYIFVLFISNVRRGISTLTIERYFLLQKRYFSKHSPNWTFRQTVEYKAGCLDGKNEGFKTNITTHFNQQSFPIANVWGSLLSSS